ncbi:glutathione-disulfide reductase [Marinivivus vitaminiproducens]|uniref:glutathione-disulfide reductase n=1 Tax=Marinivivus vitaminiproducens TaxID=3035935 RepID=UPI00279BC7A8|nr:glutathione-disulfide reductase [Geminicoccaceae bacterium SCSIO 64248]
MASFDLFVIGGGSGGVACARRAAQHGAKVGLAEHGRLGGTCVIRGCVPKKLMRYAALLGEHIDLAKGYGWQGLDAVHLDWNALLNAREAEIARLEAIYGRMLDQAGVAVFKDTARVAGPGVVEVAGERHEAKHIVIATGGGPRVPPWPGAEHAITSDDVLEGLIVKPDRLIVVGAGYIGLEQASILAGLGIDVTVLLRGDLPLRGFDHDLRSHLAREVARHGVKLQPETDVHEIRRDAASGLLTVLTSGETYTVDAVLAATGRSTGANVAKLGLDRLDIACTNTGAISVDSTYATSVVGIYAVGDCCDHAGTRAMAGQADLTPIAIAEGRAVAERLFNDNPTEIAYPTTPSAVFSLPEAATVGLSEAEARHRGFEVQIFRTDFRPMLYTLPGVERRTFMKLVVDRASDRVLGCHMVGDDAAEIIQSLAVALAAGATKAQFDATVALHPTAAEEFVTLYRAADD